VGNWRGIEKEEGGIEVGGEMEEEEVGGGADGRGG
jgi:hypothetical protein